MGYLFLTGGTGLLGSYLIRDLLRAGVKLAVLVRGTRFESAVHRVENLVARWEKTGGSRAASAGRFGRRFVPARFGAFGRR